MYVNSILLVLASWLVGVLTVQAQTPGYRIEGKLSDVASTSALLAHYYGYNQYVTKDTAQLNPNGQLVFEGSKPLPEGLYLVIPAKNKYIELIVDADQQFSFATDTANVIKHMKITGSAENEAFYTFQQRLGELQDKAAALRKQTAENPNDAAVKARVDAEFKKLQEQAATDREQFLTQHKNSFATKIILASSEPEVPPAPKDAQGRIDSNFAFNYYKAHYWDGFDFADERFIRSPVLQRKLERYMKELTVQVPDSLIKSADFLVGKAQAGKGKDMLQYVIWYITSQYEQPKVMGTDGLYVHMFDKYYKTGIMPISDPASLKTIGERVATLKQTLVGTKLTLPPVSDTLQRPINLANIKSEYVVVYFYSPQCSHCREAAPALKKFVNAHKGKDIEVVNIAIDQSVDDWKKFIREFGLQNAINGYDYSQRTDYARQYDVWTTPTTFLLDKDRKIIARKLGADQFDDFLKFYKEQQAKKKAVAKTPIKPAGK